MEQKRTLWIMAAVGVFLLVVLGAALILYSPTARSSQTIATVIPSNNNNSSGWVSLAPSEADISSQPKMPTTDSFISDSNTTTQSSQINIDEKVARVAEVTIYTDKATIINNKGSEIANIEQVPVPPVQPTQTIINNTTTIDINPVEQKVSPVTPKNEYAKNMMKKVATTEKPVVKQEPKTQKKVATTVKPTTTKKATTTVTQTTEKPKTIQYWVQVTSLTSKKSAENAREILEANKISADIFTYKDKKDQLFYRVRVGPYTTKSEAEYWKSKIAKINNFESSASYITSTTAE